MTQTKSPTEIANITSSPPKLATLIATFFGVGRLRPGSGTWGSLAAGLLWWLLATQLSPPLRLPVVLVLIVVVTSIGIPAATLEARGCGRKDPSHVVIDEVAGQLVTYIACPILWKPLLCGFILFRAFDIVKPPPIRALEKLPEGTGIVVDDLGAGIYGWIVLQALLHYHLLGG
jgi:phosphatidylglycerophosphatase A